MATLSQEALNKLASAFGQGVANEMASLGNKAAALASTPPFGTAFTQTYATADFTHDAALTDSTTGSAGATLAAGAGVFTLAIPIQLAAMTTSAADLITNYTPGFKFKILAVDFVTTQLGTGAGATQTINLEIGTTNVTGGVVNPTLSSTDTLGKITAGTAVTAANTGTSTDTLSVEVAASGTVFTAGAGVLLVKIQNMDTADAVASLAANLLDLKQLANGIIDNLQAGTVVT